MEILILQIGMQDAIPILFAGEFQLSRTFPLQLEEYTMNKNLLINGEFNIAQRGTSFDSTTNPKNDDDTYLLDRWILLSDGNDIADVSQLPSGPDGSVKSQKVVVATANKKFGFIQILENANCQQIIDAIASLSFQAKTGGNAIKNIRAGILSWTSTRDAVTSDVVSTWNSAGTDPSLATNWTYENIPFDIPLTTTYQKFAIPDISIDTANTLNIAVFIWVDDTDAAVNDELFLGQVQLEKGSEVSEFEYRSFEHELSLAQRYYEKSYDLAIAPGGVNRNNGQVWVRAIGATEATGVSWKVNKRGEPIVTVYSFQGNSGKINSSNLTEVGTSINILAINEYGWRNMTDGTAPLTSGDSYSLHFVADAEL